MHLKNSYAKCPRLCFGLNVLNTGIFQSSLWPWLPNLVYGVLGVIAAIITSGLAETLGRDLPQTLEDVGRMTK